MAFRKQLSQAPGGGRPGCVMPRNHPCHLALQPCAPVMLGHTPWFSTHCTLSLWLMTAPSRVHDSYLRRGLFTSVDKTYGLLWRLTSRIFFWIFAHMYAYGVPRTGQHKADMIPSTSLSASSNGSSSGQQGQRPPSMQHITREKDEV